MITPKRITSTWQAITSAGESGSIWPVEYKPKRKGKADVVIFHSDTIVPTGNDYIKYGKRLYLSNGNNDMMQISADNSNDIYYARCLTAGAICDINVDVI